MPDGIFKRIKETIFTTESVLELVVGMVSLVIVSFNHLITKGTANTPVLILLTILFAQQGIYQFKLDRATGGQKGVWQFTKIVIILSIIFSLAILLSY